LEFDSGDAPGAIIAEIRIEGCEHGQDFFNLKMAWQLNAASEKTYFENRPTSSIIRSLVKTTVKEIICPDIEDPDSGLCGG
jgi:hypothetical protein